MDQDEVTTRLRAVIDSLIRNEPDQAKSDLHDVLAAKMRDRVAGTTPIGPTEPIVHDHGNDEDDEDVNPGADDDAHEADHTREEVSAE